MKKSKLAVWLAIFILVAAVGLIIGQYLVLSMDSKRPAGRSDSEPALGQEYAVAEKLEKTSPEKTLEPAAIKKQEQPLEASIEEKSYYYWMGQAIELAEQEKYADALKRLDKAIEILPKRSEARGMAADINCMLGQKSYSEKEYDRAEELFNEVIYYMPNDQCGLLGLGLCAYRKDVDLEKAKAWLESYLENGGKEAVAYGTLGEIHYHENDLEKASYYLERALSRDPDNSDISRMLSRIRRERKVEKDFSTDDTSHFVVKFEGYETASVSSIILVLLEKARIVVGQILDYYPNIPITAILYSNEQFQDVTQSPVWANAIFDGKIRIPTKGLKEKTPVLERLVLHEYTHALIYECARGNPVPVWLHEGLAQNSEGRVTEDNERIFEVFAKVDRIIPLRQLEGSFLGLSPLDAKIAYAESLAAVKYMKSEYGEYVLRMLLEELADGRTMEAAIQSIFYCSYQEFDQRFLNWLNKKYD